MSRRMPCRQAGCSAIVDNGGFCAKHRGADRDNVDDLYQSRAWKSPRIGLSAAVKARNPQCQKLINIDGRLVRCINPSAVTHHCIGPRIDKSLFLFVFHPVTKKSNLVCLCDFHHPSDRPETSDWVEMKEGDLVPPGEGATDFFVRTTWEIHI